MSIRKIFIFFTIFAGTILKLSSQTPDSPTKNLTPTAMSFQRYGDIPVSMYTGTPEVSIPLDTIVSYGFSLPISLSYHSGGIKLEEHPGNVGLGWTLMLGGAITRQVNGFPDEAKNNGFFHTRNMLKGINSDNVSQYVKQQGYYAIDTEPDKFNFNFLGYHGFFMMDHEGNWQVSCDRPVRIKSYITGAPPRTLANGKTVESDVEVILGFTLECGDGATYIFGCDPSVTVDDRGGVDMSIGMQSRKQRLWQTDAWYLRKIPLNSDAAIEFQYARTKFNVNIAKYSYHIHTLDNSFTESSTGSASLISPVYLTYVSGPDFSIGTAFSESKDLRYKIADITEWMKDPTTSGALDMSYFNGSSAASIESQIAWNKLDRMYIEKNGIKNKYISFAYNENSSSRLSLREVSFAGQNGADLKKYSFSYNNIDLMPRYLSLNEDHWGYYNGPHTGNNIYQQHESDPDRTLYGTISEIVYPTGGRTVFEFEPHVYTLVNSLSTEYLELPGVSEVPPHTAGGVRIKRITDYAFNGSEPVTRDYAYIKEDNDTTSCGILECLPVYSYDIDITMGSASLQPISKVLRIESSRPLSSVINNNGFHMAYPCVRETYSDGSYTVNRFISHLDPGHEDESPLSSSGIPAFVPHTNNSALRGQPKTLRTYDSSGRLTSSSDIEYELLTSHCATSVNSLNLSSSMVSSYNSKATLNLFVYSLYKHNLSMLKPSKRTDVTFDQHSGRKKSRTSYYRYNSYAQLKTDSTVFRIGGEDHSRSVRHNYNWENNASIMADPASSSWDVMEMPVSTSYFNGADITSTLHFSYARPSGFYRLQGLSETRNGQENITLYEVNMADKYGNPLMITDKDGIQTIYLWDRHYKNPVAEISNISLNQLQRYLNYQICDAPLIQDIEMKLENLRFAFPYALIRTFQYDYAGRLSSVKEPDGTETCYTYDEQGNLNTVRDHLGHIIQKYGYSFESVPSQR